MKTHPHRTRSFEDKPPGHRSTKRGKLFYEAIEALNENIIFYL